LFRTVGIKLPTDAIPHTGRKESSAIRPRNPQNSHESISCTVLFSHLPLPRNQLQIFSSPLCPQVFSLCLLPLRIVIDQVSLPHQNNRQNYRSVHFILYVFILQKGKTEVSEPNGSKRSPILICSYCFSEFNLHFLISFQSILNSSRMQRICYICLCFILSSFLLTT